MWSLISSSQCLHIKRLWIGLHMFNAIVKAQSVREDTKIIQIGPTQEEW